MGPFSSWLFFLDLVVVVRLGDRSIYFLLGGFFYTPDEFSNKIPGWISVVHHSGKISSSRSRDCFLFFCFRASFLFPQNYAPEVPFLGRRFPLGSDNNGDGDQIRCASDLASSGCLSNRNLFVDRNSSCTHDPPITSKPKNNGPHKTFTVCPQDYSER